MDDALIDICHRLRHNAADLTILNLNYKSIANRGAFLLADALQHNTTLVVLFLQGNHITSSGGRALASSLAHHPKLRQLVLSYNHLGCDGAMALANALQHIQQLRVLKLAHCNIGTLGTTALAEALRHNSSLQTLVLQSNPRIEVDGLMTIAEALQHNETLISLDLRGCLCDGSTIHVTNVLQRSGKPFDQHTQVYKAFSDALRTNRTLRDLQLHQSSTELARNEKDLAVRSEVDQQLPFQLRLNQLGRRHFHAPSIPQAAWPRLLATATTRPCDDRMNGHLTACQVLYAVIRARPDLLVVHRPTESTVIV